MRRLVGQAGDPEADTCNLEQARSWLVLAVWAAEQQRSAVKVRGLAAGMVPFVMSAFSVSGQWAMGCRTSS